MTYIGYLAATLTTLAFIPQVIKIWKMKQAKEISLLMLLVLTAGIFLWLVYGLSIGDKPLIVANSITLVLVLILLFFKFKYK